MARIRSIHPDACKSERLAKVSAEAERCYWRLQTHCDDEGRCEDHPRLIWAALFPLHEDVDPTKVDRWLRELADVELIVRYEAGGRRYLGVTQWGRFQHPQKPRPSNIPEPPETGRVQVREDDATATRQVEPGEGEGVGDGGGGERALVPAAPGPVEVVFEAWREAAGKNGRTQLDRKRRQKITDALKAYPLEDVIDAVRGWRHSPHHRGENERATVYNDLELLLRDAKHIELFRDLERGDTSTRAGPRMPKGSDAIARAVQRREAS